MTHSVEISQSPSLASHPCSFSNNTVTMCLWKQRCGFETYYALCQEDGPWNIQADLLILITIFPSLPITETNNGTLIEHHTSITRSLSRDRVSISVNFLKKETMFFFSLEWILDLLTYFISCLQYSLPYHHEKTLSTCSLSQYFTQHFY